MPELPEVETVVRDLRPHLVGATITGARSSWARTLRTHDGEAFAAAIAGRRVEAVGRRAKQIVVDLSDDAALTIHLKMTGQLFVVPAGAEEDAYVRLVLELADGRELRFRDIRKFGKIGLYGRDPVTGELVTEVGGAALFAQIGPEPLDPAFTLRDFRRRIRRRSGPAQAAAPRPVVHRRGREHLCRRGALALTPAPASDRARRCARRTSGTCSRPSGRSWPRPSSGAGSSIDDYTAPDGDGSMQEHLNVYQRTGEPCPRCGRPVKRIVIGARSTHFCSWCQRLPARDRAGASGDPAGRRPGAGAGPGRAGPT